jgi:YVTN family beta-propeller protein
MELFRTALKVQPLWLAVGIIGLSANCLSALSTNFVNFETAPVSPIALSSEEDILAVCNLPDNRVEFFDVSGSIPRASGSVAVGLEPVTARFAALNELWVVNHISSTISIIDVAAGSVVATLETPAGPSDLVFAGNPRRAWVSCSRTNAVLVIDPQTRLAVATIAIDGERPRAMATSRDGSKVYVAIFESGNGTTVLGRGLTPLTTPAAPGPVDDPSGPYGGKNPSPNSGTNFVPAIEIAAPPPVALIVRKNSTGRWVDDNSADWTEWVSGAHAPSSGRIVGWDLPDRDVAIIDTATLQVTYAHRLMNICMAMAVNPVSGEIAVVGTDGTNERRFEPVLNGVFLRVNLALVDPITRTNRLRDLNPHLDYITRTLPQEQRALSLGDPRGILWDSSGTRAYITGMGSRNLIIVDANGHRVNPQPIELGEGPTGMALDEAHSRLYVWNRFSSTVSVVDTAGNTVVTNVPVFDPTPEIIRKGRPHLYDGRKTSGLGIAACASCHVDGRGDRLAWDLGNPAGQLSTNIFQSLTFHPMKGPMVTQTLQDIITPSFESGLGLREQSLHWRGDRNKFEEFNPTFTDLQANDVELTTNEMAEFKGMLATIFFPPNFLRTFSNSLPTSLPLPGHYGRTPTNGGPALPLPPGNALSVRNAFSCRECHSLRHGGRTPGVSELIVRPRSQHEGAFKKSHLRSLADKTGMDGSSTNSRAGFGLMHNGAVDTLTRVLVDGFGFENDQLIADHVAFLLCLVGSDFTTIASANFSQDVPAAVGKQVTFASSTPPPLLNAMFDLSLRANSRVQLVIRGRKNGQPRSWLLRRATSDFQSDRHGEIAPTLADVIASASPGNEFTATLVPEGSGVRIALDRDGDGYFDTTEINSGSNPADPASYAFRFLGISQSGGSVTLRWESVPGGRYAVHWRASLSSGDWNALAAPLIATNLATSYTDSEPQLHRFYRISSEP